MTGYLTIKMQEFDRNRSGTLDKLEFEEFITKLGIFLATQELTTVYNHFDMNKDGMIQYDEFIGTLRVSKYQQLGLTVSNRLI